MAKKSRGGRMTAAKKRAAKVPLTGARSELALPAGTVVVREREAEAPAFAEVFASPVSDPALRRSFKPVLFAADINNLTEQEISVVESFLRRRWDLKDYPRQWMAWRVSLPLLYKLRPRYDLATFTYEGFLEELLHRYRARHRFTE